jgi:hypothetical protein
MPLLGAVAAVVKTGDNCGRFIPALTRAQTWTFVNNVAPPWAAHRIKQGGSQELPEEC